jgi:serine protease inhibitor
VKKIFTKKAELDDIAEDLYISDIVQKVVIVVDEEGTEAAAVTVARGIKKSIAVKFICDHSFVYYIKHVPSQEILFLGKYNGQ